MVLFRNLAFTIWQVAWCIDAGVWRASVVDCVEVFYQIPEFLFESKKQSPA
jgi:hypothetical protein